jgi:hypothetical protein
VKRKVFIFFTMQFLWLLGYSQSCPCPDSAIVYQDLDKEAMPLNIDEFRRALVFPQIMKDAMILPDKLVFKFEISESGQLLSWSNCSSKYAYPVWVNAVEKTISVLRFKPAMWQGKPVKSCLTIPVIVHVSY